MLVAPPKVFIVGLVDSTDLASLASSADVTGGLRLSDSIAELKNGGVIRPGDCIVDSSGRYYRVGGQVDHQDIEELHTEELPVVLGRAALDTVTYTIKEYEETIRYLQSMLSTSAQPAFNNDGEEAAESADSGTLTRALADSADRRQRIKSSADRLRKELAENKVEALGERLKLIDAHVLEMAELEDGSEQLSLKYAKLKRENEEFKRDRDEVMAVRNKISEIASRLKEQCGNKG